MRTVRSASPLWSPAVLVGLVCLVGLAACTGEDDGTGGNGSGVGSGDKGGAAGSSSLNVGGRTGGPAGAGGVAGMAPSPVVCGDGKVEGAEICDDGNATADDGCSAACVVEDGYFCSKLGGKPCLREIVCGDGRLDGDEVCDDGNVVGGDGCSVGCRKERGFDCKTPGQKCAATSVAMACGNKVREGDELCDDGNTVAGDGCDAKCGLEAGWRCPDPGAACVTVCGDGVRQGTEDCDDGNVTAGDGCSVGCQREPGYACDGAPSKCGKVCGNGLIEAGETCDDNNTNAFDGCSPDCRLEPTCGQAGALDQQPACVTTFGDGLLGNGEECDDGNTVAGDGCSPSGKIELGTGMACAKPAKSLRSWRVLRDFSRFDFQHGHPDFFATNSGAALMPGFVSTQLSATGRPAVPATNTPPSISSAASFAQWYVDDEKINKRVDDPFELNATTAGGFLAYQAMDNAFFPLDGRGWNENDGPHNFYWTSETRFWLRYPGTGSEKIELVGNDDMYVFFAGQKVLDMGGIHGPKTGQVAFPGGADKGKAVWQWDIEPGMTFPATVDLGLVAGETYELRIFHANRQPNDSVYGVALTGFESLFAGCVSSCGDGIVSPDELCDPAAPGLGVVKCRADCLGFGPFCGDGKVDSSEACDDGALNGTAGKCSLACTVGTEPKCGDGQTDAGEECDDGPNATSAYGACLPTCKRAPHCGDGGKNGPEQCDDGNAVNGDGCTKGCHDEKL